MFRYSRDELILAGRILLIVMWAILLAANLVFIFVGSLVWLSIFASICAGFNMYTSVSGLIKYLDKHKHIK